MSDADEKPREENRQRVLFVSSAGGHLAQLLRLEDWYEHHDTRWVCFRLPDAVNSLPADRTTWAFHPTTRNVKNLLRNARLALREIRDWRPDLIVSSGAGVAVPFFWLGKVFGARTVYVEVVDRLDTRTLTARLVSPVTDLVVVQSPSQQALLPGSHLVGRLL